MKIVNLLLVKNNKNFSALYDLDIYIFLPSLKIHIASAGAILPDYIFSLTNNNDIIYDYYKTDNIKNEYLVNPNLEEIVYQKEYLKNKEFSKEIYLKSFINHASKGFFSFDKTNIQNPDDKQFHLVAYPINRNDKGFNNLYYLKENLSFLQENFESIMPLLTNIRHELFNPFYLNY